ncbi:MAG TPA: Nif11-like leader peptide family natural product precursor [Thermoanaerobaculia bacterium]|nr:Nif11-like leader peptide family natural product precursor [Thermoanaerobaculia bacterium]
MSKEQAIGFIEKTEGDISLQTRIKSIKKGDWEAFQAIAKEAGFEFTAEDFHAVLGDFKKRKPGMIEANFGTVEHDVPPGKRKT